MQNLFDGKFKKSKIIYTGLFWMDQTLTLIIFSDMLWKIINAI